MLKSSLPSDQLYAVPKSSLSFCGRPFARNRKHKGFSLIELMTVVAILSILLAIVVPSYQAHVRKARRVDAKAMLLDLAGRQERYNSVYNAYADTFTKLGYTAGVSISIPNSSQPNYLITITTGTATAFKAQAAPTGDQTSDACGTFIIDQLGAQTTSGGSVPANQCW
ncbi:MAG: type IV pilin protein [Pseudomonadota bacterium]